MKSYEVRFRPMAEADLVSLYDYIAAELGAALAGTYIDRIESACRGLEDFPKRGAPRGDLGPGLRILAFEKRVTIAYRIAGSVVEIVRVFYGGRDLAAFIGRPR